MAILIFNKPSNPTTDESHPPSQHTPHSRRGNGNVHQPVQQDGGDVLREVRVAQAQGVRPGLGRDVLHRSMRGEVPRISREGGCGIAEGQRGAGEDAAESGGDAEYFRGRQVVVVTTFSLLVTVLIMILEKDYSQYTRYRTITL